eukprot:jgi/Tetstr1/456676/TSEL_043377.t1
MAKFFDFLKNCFFTLLWLIVLVFIALPIAFICAPFFIFCQMPEALCHCGINTWFRKGIEFPGYCTEKMLAPFGRWSFPRYSTVKQSPSSGAMSMAYKPSCMSMESMQSPSRARRRIRGTRKRGYAYFLYGYNIDDYEMPPR